MPVNVRIEGLQELAQRMGPEALQGPLHEFWEKCGLAIQARAKPKAPVDTGRLRSSIAYDIDSRATPLWVRVGPNVNYGAFMEYGTGRLCDPSVKHSNWHYPTGPQLERWASRHHSDGWTIAAAIRRAGGLKPRPYMRPALEKSIQDIKRFLRELGAAIVERLR